MMRVDEIKVAIQKLKEGLDALGRGPLDFYLGELKAGYDLLMDRFAPFKVGDRVALTKAPDFDESPGWAHSRHFLVPGALGTVVAATCGKRGFRFGVVFDDESWVDTVGYQRPKGTIVPFEERNKHEYGFGEGWLTKI